MKLNIYQINAFSNAPFGGNPAAVVPLDNWLDDTLLQKIAAQNNLSETAFVVKNGQDYDIRWMTPEVEVDLCGHATLATAYYLFNLEGISPNVITFHSKSGKLMVTKSVDGKLNLDFPSAEIHPVPDIKLFDSCGITNAKEIWKAKDDYLVILEHEDRVVKLSPDFNILKNIPARGVIVSALGQNSDFVCRFFAPNVGINEDPVTGSAFTKLIPYWSQVLQKNDIIAFQLSQRVGQVWCSNLGERVLIGGFGNLYLKGEIYI